MKVLEAHGWSKLYRIDYNDSNKRSMNDLMTQIKSFPNNTNK